MKDELSTKDKIINKLQTEKEKIKQDLLKFKNFWHSLMSHFHKRICYENDKNYKIVSNDLYKNGISDDNERANNIYRKVTIPDEKNRKIIKRKIMIQDFKWKKRLWRINYQKQKLMKEQVLNIVYRGITMYRV